jgi:hypothetical protein
MNKTLLAIAACAALAYASPVPAGAVQMNGQLPMYPHAKLDPKESSLTPAAIAHGVPMVLLSSDSVQTVDAWYSSHLPKSCTRQAASGGVKYACPTGSIMIYAHGGTQIAFVPAFPHF